MAWKVELSGLAQKNLDQLDSQIARRILSFLFERVKHRDDPRNVGEPFKGSKLGEFWEYRVGDYRIISSLEYGALRVLVMKSGNRREVYR